VPSPAFTPFPDADVESSVAACFAASAARFAERIAVSETAGPVTFAELHARAERVAAAVRAAGIGAGDRVAVLCEHGSPFLAAMLAVLKAGAAYVPLNPVNTDDANAQILHLADSRLLLCDGANRDHAEALVPAGCGVLDIDGPVPEEPAASISVEPGDLAGIFFTSGTTGEPKGVVHSQRNMLHAARCFTNSLEISAGDRLLWGYHGSTCASVKNILAPLLCGATLCPWDMRRDGAGAMADWIAG